MTVFTLRADTSRKNCEWLSVTCFSPLVAGVKKYKKMNVPMATIQM